MKLSKSRLILFTLLNLNKHDKTNKLNKLTSVKSWNDETDLLYGPPIKKTNFVPPKIKNDIKKVEIPEKNDNVKKLGSDTDILHTSKSKIKEQLKKEKLTENIENKSEGKFIRDENKSSHDECSPEKSQEKTLEEEKKADSVKSTKANKTPKEEVKKVKKEKKKKGSIVEDDDDDEERTDVYDYQEATPEEIELILAGKFPLTYPAFPEGHKFRKKESSNPSNNDEKSDLDKILKVPLFDNSLPQEFIKWNSSTPPSVSLILKSTMSEESKKVLEEWEKRMIASMGITEFESYKKDLFENGSLLHGCIKSFLQGQLNVDIPSSIEGYWNSVQPVLEEVDNVIALELPVHNKFLNYKGILDGVATYKGQLCLIEWKTSKRLKSSLDKTFDNPVQLVAYLAAFNAQLTHPEFDIYKKKISKLKPQKDYVENCLLVITYEDGSKASVHYMDRAVSNKYWGDWLRRLRKYWTSVNA